MEPTQQRHINKLTSDKQYKLMKLVEAEYSTRRQTDVDFATYAKETLGFELNSNNVFGARRALNIEATRNVSTNTALESRVVLLEKRLAELEEHHNNLAHAVHGLGSDKRLGGRP